MSDPTIAAWHRQDELRKELRRLHEVEVAYGVMKKQSETRIAELEHALDWIARRCPEQFLKQEPHRVHWEAAYDAGACARAALDRAGGEK
jgi:hypothetical protein